MLSLGAGGIGAWQCVYGSPEALDAASRRTFIKLTRHLYPPLNEPNRMHPDLFPASTTYAALQEVCLCPYL